MDNKDSDVQEEVRHTDRFEDAHGYFSGLRESDGPCTLTTEEELLDYKGNLSTAAEAARKLNKYGEKKLRFLESFCGFSFSDTVANMEAQKAVLAGETLIMKIKGLPANVDYDTIKQSTHVLSAYSQIKEYEGNAPEFIKQLGVAIAMYLSG